MGCGGQPKAGQAGTASRPTEDLVMKARATIVLALVLLACAGCKPPNLLPPGDTAKAPAS